MKLLTNLTSLGMMLLLITFASSCSTYSKPLIPKLENRTLRISKDLAGFEYKYCFKKKRKFLGKKKCVQWKTDYYTLGDKRVREMLISMGFVLTSPNSLIK